MNTSKLVIYVMHAHILYVCITGQNPTSFSSQLRQNPTVKTPQTFTTFFSLVNDITKVYHHCPMPLIVLITALASSQWSGSKHIWLVVHLAAHVAVLLQPRPVSCGCCRWMLHGGLCPTILVKTPFQHSQTSVLALLEGWRVHSIQLVDTFGFWYIQRGTENHLDVGVAVI